MNVGGCGACSSVLNDLLGPWAICVVSGDTQGTSRSKPQVDRVSLSPVVPTSTPGGRETRCTRPAVGTEGPHWSFRKPGKVLFSDRGRVDPEDKIIVPTVRPIFSLGPDGTSSVSTASFSDPVLRRSNLDRRPPLGDSRPTAPLPRYSGRPKGGTPGHSHPRRHLPDTSTLGLLTPPDPPFPSTPRKPDSGPSTRALPVRRRTLSLLALLTGRRRWVHPSPSTTT